MSHRKSGQIVRTKRRVLWQRQRHRCYWCTETIPEPDDGSLDHLIPPKLGGPLGYWNLVLACLDCNVQRGAPLLGRRRDERDGWIVWSPSEGNMVIHDRSDPRLLTIRAELQRDEPDRDRELHQRAHVIHNARQEASA